jgi:hypothetical protein
VRTAAQFHGITIERPRRPTNLQNTHGVAVFLSEELDDVASLLRFRIRDFRPRNRRVFRDLFSSPIFQHRGLFLRNGALEKSNVSLSGPT